MTVSSPNASAGVPAVAATAPVTPSQPKTKPAVPPPATSSAASLTPPLDAVQPVTIKGLLNIAT